jgi:hypothetical protein
VRQDEVIGQVRERLALDGHAQLGHVREVRGAEPTGRMVLGEEHLLVGTAGRAPMLNAPLQSTELSIGEAAGMPALHLLEESLGFPARCCLEQLDDFGPYVGERILASPPVPRRRLRLPLRR